MRLREVNEGMIISYGGMYSLSTKYAIDIDISNDVILIIYEMIVICGFDIHMTTGIHQKTIRQYGR
jgi:hypothetical protein